MVSPPLGPHFSLKFKHFLRKIKLFCFSKLHKENPQPLKIIVFPNENQAFLLFQAFQRKPQPLKIIVFPTGNQAFLLFQASQRKPSTSQNHCFS